MRKIKIDWLKAKEDFLLDSYVSLKEIALKYDLSYSKIKKISADRDWFEDKKQIQKLIDNALMREVGFKIKNKISEQTKNIRASYGKKYQEKENKLCKKIATLMGAYEPEIKI